MPKQSTPTKPPRERAVLVGTELRKSRGLLPLADSIRELGLLAETAGLDVVGEVTQRLSAPDPKTYIGSGKVQEVRRLAAAEQADVLLFDDELSPRHQRELEKILGEETRVVDRTALILDVFAQHANTRDGALQVELAQYEYRLPRLTRAWTHLARQAGGGAGRTGSVGGVGLRGPGETQLEVDRREIGRRIAHLKKELEKVRAHRGRHRARRRRSEAPTVAIVGYTNAGKSTLLNRLADAHVHVADQLFATLDPTTRRVDLPNGRYMLITDTVGFIQKLPTMLVAAFRATLEEIAEADLLLHVVDITHANAEAQTAAVLSTLGEIGAAGIPIVTALNKIDLLTEPWQAESAVDDFDRAVPVSALTGEGIPALLTALDHELYERMAPIQVKIPYKAGRLISLFHEHGAVEQVEHTRSHVKLTGRLPLRLQSEFEPYQADGDVRAASEEAAD